MKLNAPIVTAIVATIALLATLASGMYQLGQLSNQVENLALQNAQLREENRRDYEELRRDNTELREENRRDYEELRRDNAELREEFRRDNAALRDELQRGDEAMLDELRRSVRQLLEALSNHTHNADGDAVFTLPPGSEPAPAGETPAQ